MVVEEARYTYPTQLTNSFDRENWTVSTDHCYARPWNWRPEANFLRPTKTLFVPKLVPIKSSVNSSVTIQEGEDLIDIESEIEVPAPTYDVAKAKSLMEECEKHAFAARTDTEEDWEEKISRLNWTTSQHKIFGAMVNILNSFNLSKLAYSGSQNEPLLRRTVIDKAVQRIRRLLASVLWDPKLTQWLHQILIDNLGPHYLACYLDILQTLKSKIPTFIDKMMHGSTSSVRMGTLNNSNLASLMEKPWDPLSPTLMQDKPKKLPGNPVIIIVPSGPIMSKIIHKWIKLLSNLATVVTVPTNFGSTGHRMTMPSILDQLFSVTRGKIQDVRDDFPGKNIILVGFNSGAALALQVAQVEPVLCVISVGFSLLTAEGLRGEPDDNVLELQCPVLFVIGQCSNTSNQEDLEDMRERMRVETGLLVVGSADDYLRVSKKKRRQEGITQSIVDRCVVDEIGEFVSGLILSPYPPQIRQSPAHIPPETPIKKVGRPPGSKSKNRLEAKWAQQIAQARMHAFGINRNVIQGNTSVTNLLQGGIKTIPPTLPKASTSGIKVLENVTLNSSASGKLIPNRTIDLSKITLINPSKTPSTSVSNVLLLPDGKIKTIGSTIKGTGNNPLLLPYSPQKGTPKTTMTTGPKYITAKRQLMNQKPPRPIKKPVYMPASNLEPSLPPPTNLTTQDIMDLPIIFADDNQILSTNSSPSHSLQTPTVSTRVSTPTSVQIPKTVQTVTPAKYMLVNKQTIGQRNFILTPNIKRGSPVTFNKPTPKYTKIILSSKKNNLEEVKAMATTSKIQCLSPEITVKKVINAQQMLKPSATPPSTSSLELVDLENEIKATAVPKPNLSTSDIKNIKIIPKNANESLQLVPGKFQKRPSTEILDEGDPDYVPPKNLKME
ncbi:unnamed protein product [Psylliodes chrysocephalus]|nr:unnamed protein product [Psylliodes chrysocephala]